MQDYKTTRCALAGVLMLALGVAAPVMAGITVVNFEDVDLPAPYSGGGRYYNGADSAGGFSSGGVNFPNRYDPGFGLWSGFAASSTTDTTTSGFANQYSAITGGGYSGSQYAVGYYSAFENSFPTVDFGRAITLTSGHGVYITNTTYAALSMRDGDGFAREFGGLTGDDPDFFLLTIEGLLGGAVSRTIDFHLADYRFTDSTQDYIVEEWSWVDLSGLGEVDGLRFSFTSSDVGMFGINTPTYFAMDDLTIPEPGAAALLALAGVALVRRSRN